MPVMPIRRSTAILAGALLTSAIAVGGARLGDADFAASLERQAGQAIARTGSASVSARFATGNDWPTRHPTLAGGKGLSEATRERIARAVAALPGVGGVRWADGSIRAQAGPAPLSARHCQDDVNALLKVRTIRFEEGSSRIDRPSRKVLDEVAAALRPCTGSIISITGHTDQSGPEPANLALSDARAQAVRRALIERGIAAGGLRARGMGSGALVPGLSPQDPANRRIEFAVIATSPLVPTPVDTPGAR